MRLNAVFKNLFRTRLNSSIIIVSLSIGIACMNLITILITRENNADGFHKNKNRIYALQTDDPFRKGEKMYFIRYGAAEYMKDNFAEVDVAISEGLALKYFGNSNPVGQGIKLVNRNGVAIACIIAMPVGWYFMHKWLENFAYKTTLSWWIFALAGLLALGIAMLTVSFQSWRAATRNPVEALRYE